MSGPAQGQSIQIGMAVVVGLAVFGFFVGTGHPPEGHSPLVSEEEAHEVAGEHGASVPSYTALRGSPRGSESWSADAAKLAGPGVLDAVELEGTSKEAVLRDRASNRAYDGAPPTIPHPVRQSAAAECLACHADGLMLRGRLASPMSHTELASCTQCHVVSEAPMPGEALPPDATAAENRFVGLASPGKGERAWSIAPPEIPHRLHMRDQCMSCHGPNGRDAMRSTHPDRQSCTQCHAPDASLDQRTIRPSTP